ncbi:MAG TPA: VWA domain-containing protein [Acidimicrobiia bacterium]|nr:VWA domain-containing protein [Acidimicrobiia bacterium]
MSGDTRDLERFGLLATFLAGRPLAVTEAPPGDAAHTDGRYVFVSAGGTTTEQRRDVVLHAALLGAGSLDTEPVKAVRGRPKVARRYLALEGRRVLADLAEELPLVRSLGSFGDPATGGVDESLALACSRRAVVDPPAWFGVIRPSRLLGASPPGPGTAPTDKDLRLEFKLSEVPEADEDDDEEGGEESKILKLFQNPLSNSKAISNFLSKMLGMSRAPGTGGAGGEMAIGSIRRVDRVGPDARPMPVPLRFADDAPGPASGYGGALYPEWDVHKDRYRAEWCRVIEFPLGPATDIAAGAVESDEVLRRRLARLGLGPKVLRRRADGEDLDVDALIDLAVDLRAGHSPAENIYLERRKLARNLGVLILVDASGSATETDPDGLSVHEHQRRAAATLAVTLEELGDRVAVYGFRSRGRSAVHMLALKPFGQRFGAGGRAQLNQLEPAGYTRLGAAIRHSGELLKTEAGTPNRLLLVLSDGFPYDDGYESRYAEADAHRALVELRSDGVACLCLSIGGSTPADALDRVFGSASHASAATLAELSPHMDELFLSALRELAVGQSRQ